jgi:hypothetical protein
MTVQYRFACIKLQAAKGFVAIVQVQLLVQQLAPIMRHDDDFASVQAEYCTEGHSAKLMCSKLSPHDHEPSVQASTVGMQNRVLQDFSPNPRLAEASNSLIHMICG